jgi:hypothetical protein
MDTRSSILSATEEGSDTAKKALTLVEQADKAFFAALDHKRSSFTVMLNCLIHEQ